MRASVWKRTLPALVSGIFVWLAAGTSVQAGDVLNFHVLKDGEKIGHEKVEITQTADGHVVRVETLTDVQVLFLRFHYDHQRTERWHGNTLVSVETTTNDDGTHYTYQASYQDDCYALAGKGVGKRDACDNAWPLTLWHEDVTRKTNLYSVINAEPYRVETRKIGDEKLMVGNRETPATHYVMSGDIKRDLWYGPDGKLLKTSFKRRGYDIDFIRVDVETLQK